MALNDDRLNVGSIIFEYVTTTNPPKNKYYVVVGITDDHIALGTVYINSEVNPNLFRAERLKKLHIPVLASDNPFLKWDSFIDCSQIQERLTSDVYDCITSGDPKYGYIANLTVDTLQTVIATLDSALTIAPIIKKKYKIRAA